jgi:hypothetical protein
VLLDNPWNTTRRAAPSLSQPNPFVVDELPRRSRPADRAPKVLPADPSVALPVVPAAAALVSTPRLHTAGPGDALVVSSTGSGSEAPKLPEIETTEAMDPLGVGMW